MNTENFYETAVSNGDCTVKLTAVRHGAEVTCDVVQIKGHDAHRRQHGTYRFTDDPSDPRPIKRWADNAYDAWSSGD